MKHLKKRWEILWKQISSTDPEPEFSSLYKAYTQPQRSYHNLLHIQDALSQLDLFKQQVGHLQIFELALWFHDVVYNPESSTNEFDSAQWASHSLSKGKADPLLIKAVASLILLTCHIQPPETDDQKLFLDIDLAILGKSLEEYHCYELAIRKEYQQIPLSLYKKHRLKCLHSFLERPRIYFTDTFYKQYEQQARLNLNRAIQALQPCSDSL